MPCVPQKNAGLLVGGTLMSAFIPYVTVKAAGEIAKVSWLVIRFRLSAYQCVSPQLCGHQDIVAFTCALRITQYGLCTPHKTRLQNKKHTKLSHNKLQRSGSLLSLGQVRRVQHCKASSDAAFIRRSRLCAQQVARLLVQQHLHSDRAQMCVHV